MLFWADGQKRQKSYSEAAENGKQGKETIRELGRGIGKCGSSDNGGSGEHRRGYCTARRKGKSTAVGRAAKRISGQCTSAFTIFFQLGTCAGCKNENKGVSASNHICSIS